MTRVHRFARLTHADRALLISTALLVVAIRIVLRVRRWPSVLRVLSGHSLSVSLFSRACDCSVWAVRRCSCVAPGATCLAQALKLQRLLTCAGRGGLVHIAVAKDAHDGFRAHAWEHGGDTLLSTSADVERYLRLLSLEFSAASRPVFREP
jgi:hypothetical protein